MSRYTPPPVDDASAISIADAGGDFTATDVEGALAELQADNEAHVAAADPHTGYVLESLVDAKGDLIVASADNTVTRLAVGTNDHVLTADSSTGTGVKWAAVSGSGAVATDAIWDAAGDLAVGTGANTAAKLTVGTALTTRLVNTGSGTLAWVPHIVYVATADGPISGDNTLSDDAGLQFSIEANSVYMFWTLMEFTSNGTTGDAKFGWSVPGTTTMKWGPLASGGGAGGGYHLQGAASSPGFISTESSTIAVGSVNGTFGVGLFGKVFADGTGGTVNFQWAQNTSDAQTLTRAANAVLFLWRVV